MGVLVEAGDERIRRHALSCGSTRFGDGAWTEKEEERAKAKHRELPYRDVKVGERFRAMMGHGHMRWRCSRVAAVLESSG